IVIVTERRPNAFDPLPLETVLGIRRRLVRDLQRRLSGDERLLAAGQRRLGTSEPDLDLAGGRAAIVARRVAVVALLAAGALHHAVAARRRVADALAARAFVLDGAGHLVVARRAVRLETVRRAVGLIAGAVLRDVALPGVGPTFDGRRHERVGRTRGAPAVAALGDVADARRRTAE